MPENMTEAEASVDEDVETNNVDAAIVAVGDSETASAEKPPSQVYAISSTISRGHCIFISFIILLSHALFIWGQLSPLWAQFAYTKIEVDANATSNISKAAMEYKYSETSVSIGNDQSYLIGSWSYGGMLNELWTYSKITAVFLFLFSALWPHLKLVLLHVYFYRPVPSKPRQAAMYWLDAVGKMSLADVCATCMLFLLLNIQADIDVNTLANHATQLLGVVIPQMSNLPAAGVLSDEMQTLLDDVGASISGEVAELIGEDIFANEDPKLYQTLLEAGCSKYAGDTCIGTPFYQPSILRGGIASIMMKCMRIRNDKCYQCECIVNNAIYNHDIPGEVIQTDMKNAMPLLLTKFLSLTKSENIDFGSWFGVSGNASVGMYITIYPAFLGFTIAVILSIAASLIVAHVDEKESMKRNLNAMSLDEALKNGGHDMDQRALLFGSSAIDGSGKGRLFLSIICGIGIIPLVFFAIYIDMFNFSIAGLFEELILMKVMATQKLYSIIDCVVAVNDGSGYGKTFAVLYGTMLLGIPMLRAVLLAIISVVPMSPLWHVRIARMSNNVGSYIGWEPFLICILLLGDQLPSMTEETVKPEVCQNIEDNYLMSQLIAHFGLDDTNTCFVMRFDMLPAFSLFVVSWFFMTGFNAFAWKVVLKRYDPFGTQQEDWDSGGPYFRQCCYFGCFKKQCIQETTFDNKN